MTDQERFDVLGIDRRLYGIFTRDELIDQGVGTSFIGMFGDVMGDDGNIIPPFIDPNNPYGVGEVDFTAMNSSQSYKDFLNPKGDARK